MFGELEDVAYIGFGEEGGGLYIVGGCGGATPLPASGILKIAAVDDGRALGGAAVYFDLHGVIVQECQLLFDAESRGLDQGQGAGAGGIEVTLGTFDFEEDAVAGLVPHGDGADQFAAFAAGLAGHCWDADSSGAWERGVHVQSADLQNGTVCGCVHGKLQGATYGTGEFVFDFGIDGFGFQLTQGQGAAHGG